MMEAGNLNGVQTNASARLNRAPVGTTALHETAFFRDRDTFDALRETLLPRIIEANMRNRRLGIWCAGCSTGQEAYSIAMLLRENFADQLADWDVEIVATDLAGSAIEYARRGRYRRAEVNRGLPARMLVRCFVREGDEWEIVPELRAMCEFRKGDVCTQIAEPDVYDLVLMRNVLLFLPEQDRAAAFASVHRRLAAHGVLALGQAEQAEDSTDLFEAEYMDRCCFYRKTPAR
ncbi:MAG TPA: CheR family methyltransferase [Acidobacteriaceae bacterium]|nr:CheR family methyltransferase [Acidobacteriaceae bacterium]